MQPVFQVHLICNLQCSHFNQTTASNYLRNKQTNTPNKLYIHTARSFTQIKKLFKIFTHVIQISHELSINYLDIVNSVIFGLKFPNSCISFQTYLVCKQFYSLILPVPTKVLNEVSVSWTELSVKRIQKKELTCKIS